MKNKINFLLCFLFVSIMICYADETTPPSLPSHNIWIGVNNNWNDAANWSQKCVPGFHTNVVINKVEEPYEYPVVSTNNNYIGNCTINKNAILTIADGGELIVKYNLVNDGKILIKTIKDDYGSLIIRGDISGSGSYSSSLLIKDKLYHYYGIPHENLTYGDVKSSNSAIKVKQYINDVKGYQALDLNYAFETPMQGYLMGILTKTPIILEGKIYQNGFVYNLKNEFNLISNPFVAPIDIEALFKANQHLIDAEIMNKSLITFEEIDGHYKLHTHYVNEPVLGSHQIDRVIKPGETFLIRANKEGFFVIDESFCKAKSEIQSYNFSDTNNRQYIRLKLHNSQMNDDVVLVIDKNGDINRHKLHDCYKMPFFTYLNKAHLAFYIHKKEHQIKFINFVDGVCEIPLRINFVNNSNATSFTAELSNAFPENIIVELIDSKATNPFNLRNGAYEFAIGSGMNYQFSLRLTMKEATDIANANEDVAKMFCHDGIIYCEGLQSSAGCAYELYDINGRLLEKNTLHNNTIKVHQYSGIVICKITDKNITISKTLLIR